MAQYITLEEAAERLGMPMDEFKRRLKIEWTHLVPMRDGPTLRFRVNQIEELARQLGAASDPGLPLAAMPSDAEPGSEDFKIRGGAAARSKAAEEPLLFDSSEDDVFSLSADASKPGQSKSGKSKGDSDVRLEGPKSDKDAGVVPTEEIALDVSGPGSAVIKGGSSAKLSAPKSSAKLSASDSGKKLSAQDLTNLSGPEAGDSSEFELSLDADSDDFELQMSSDSSEEVDLGSSPVDEAGGGAGKSGVNLHAPSDSGISLEKGKKDSSGRLAKKPDSGRKKPQTESDSDLDFELSLEPEESSASGKRKSGAKSSPKVPVTSDSDSEFELTLDDSGEGSSLEAAAAEDESKGDIFETDFEIPPMTDESGSEAVAIESDTDLEEPSEVEIALDEGDVSAEDETGSQVVLLEDEEEAPTPSSRRRRAAATADDVDLAEVEEESVGSALRGVKGRRRDEEEEEEEEEEAVGAGRAAAAPAPWGPIPAIALSFGLIFTLLGTLMGYEMLHTMMGYQQPRQPAAPIVRGLASNLDMELRDQ